MSSIHPSRFRPAIAIVAGLLLAACSDGTSATAPVGAAEISNGTPGAAASKTSFEIGPFNFVGDFYLECIDEVVTVNNLGVHLDIDVLTTGSGNTMIRARIYWPDNLFFVERQNGVRYYQLPNATSRFHEFIGPIHRFTLVDSWQLRAADGSMLKFQSRTQVTFDDAGVPVDVKVTGSCPNSPA